MVGPALHITPGAKFRVPLLSFWDDLTLPQLPSLGLWWTAYWWGRVHQPLGSVSRKYPLLQRLGGVSCGKLPNVEHSSCSIFHPSDSSRHVDHLPPFEFLLHMGEPHAFFFGLSNGLFSLQAALALIIKYTTRAFSLKFFFSYWITAPNWENEYYTISLVTVPLAHGNWLRWTELLHWLSPHTMPLHWPGLSEPSSSQKPEGGDALLLSPLLWDSLHH